MSLRSSLMLTLCSGAIFGLGACTDPNNDSSADPTSSGRVVMCHISAADPTAMASIAVDPNAVKAALAEGDLLGSCETAAAKSGTNSNGHGHGHGHDDDDDDGDGTCNLGCAGPVGPAGVAGAAGPTGPVGPVGPAGANGAQGLAGPAGAAGPIGPVGPVGAAGPMGPAGANGAQGQVGPAGADGHNGVNGAQGPAGADGAPGPQGPPGANGLGQWYSREQFLLLLPQQQVSRTAKCDPGDILIGHAVAGQQINVLSSGMFEAVPLFTGQADQGWTVTVKSTAVSGGANYIDVIAYCLDINGGI